MRDLFKIYIAMTFITASEGGLNVIYPPFLEQNGYSLELVGGLVSLFAVLQLVSRLPTGAFYSRARARLIIGLALAAFGLSTMGYALGAGLPWLGALTALHGLAFGVVGTAMLAFCIELRPAGYSTAATMSWYTASLSAGYMVGNTAGGWLADTFGYGLAFLVVGAVPVVSLLAIWLVTAPAAPQPAITSPQSAIQNPKSKIQRLKSYLADMKAVPAGVFLAAFIAFYINVLDDAFGAFFPLYGLGIGLTLANVGLLKSIKSGCATGIRFMAAGVFRFVSFRAINDASIVAWTLAIFLLPGLQDGLLLAALFVVIGLARGLTRVTSATIVAEAKAGGGKGVGLASGVYNLGLDVGGILGPLLGGVLAAGMGIAGMFRALPVGLFALYLGVVWWTRRGTGSRQ